MKSFLFSLQLCAVPSLIVLGAATAQAGGEVRVTPTPPTAAAAPIGALPGQYSEAYCYSSYARRSYAPGFTPNPASLSMNARVYPAALCVIATPYHQWAGIPGWFFGSPVGYQSVIPPGSAQLAYLRGEVGITRGLQGGYPEGKRVIEPVIVPEQGYCRPGGILILGSSKPIVTATCLPAPGDASSAQGQVKGAQLEK